MSYYRDNYLKSDHWQNLRLERLVQSKCTCVFCGFKSVKNDIHHITYGESLWTIKAEHLRVLCRRCHERVHQIIDTHPSLSLISHKDRWLEICRIIEDDRIAINKSAERERKLARQIEVDESWHEAFLWCWRIAQPWAYRMLTHMLNLRMATEDAGRIKHKATFAAQRSAKLARLAGRARVISP